MFLIHLLIKLQLERSFHMGEVRLLGTNQWLMHRFQRGAECELRVGKCLGDAIRGLH